MKNIKKLIGFIALLALVVVGANAAIESYDQQESLYYNIYTLLIGNDLPELFTVQTEVTAARDGEASLLDQINDLQLYKTEVTAARDGESSLLNQVNTLQASIVAVTAANGSLVSSNDTVTGFLNGKIIAGEGIDLTEGNDGGDETLSISGEDASTSNKGIASFNSSYFSTSSGAVSPRNAFYNALDTDTALTLANIQSGRYRISNYDGYQAVNHTLPPLSNVGSRGYLEVCVADNYYIKLTADASDSFRYGSATSADGGYIRTDTPGRCFVIRAVDDEWFITWLNGPIKMDE